MTNYEILMSNLQELKLSAMADNFNLVQNEIMNNNVSIVDSLLKLTNLQIESVKTKRRDAMVSTAGFPYRRRIEDYDFDFQPELNKNQVLELSTLGYLNNNENVVFYGNSGSGKTHLAVSLGILAAEKGLKTYFVKCGDLIKNLKKAKLLNNLERKLKSYSSYRLLIIDELGYLPLDKEDSKLLFELIDSRYEKKSTIITTTVHFSKWNNFLKDEMLASAILDRILHHAHIVSIKGESYRLKNHMKKD